MQTLTKFSIIALTALLLSSCGGGGGSSGSNSNSNNNNSSNNNNNNSKPPLNQNTISNSTFDKFGHACNLTVINNFTLPPCPNQELSDSTLLGLDNNNNGVRDDVERWLILKYKDHHPIVTEIGFQGARAHQFMLEYPDRWEEANSKVEAYHYCNVYFELTANEYNEPILIDHGILTEKRLYKVVQFNTNPRVKAYLQYDQKLSGGVYTSPKESTYRSFCLFDIDKLLHDFPAENYVLPVKE